MSDLGDDEAKKRKKNKKKREKKKSALLRARQSSAGTDTPVPSSPADSVPKYQTPPTYSV